MAEDAIGVSAHAGEIDLATVLIVGSATDLVVAYGGGCGHGRAGPTTKVGLCNRDVAADASVSHSDVIVVESQWRY